MMVVGLVGMILTGCNNHHREEAVVDSTPVAADSDEYASDEYEDDLQTDKYVDLGLSSGTKWSNVNEDGLYTFGQAVSKFGSNLPTGKQWEELYNECEWKWRETGGYRVTGPNGKSITLPAEGYRNCDGSVGDVGSNGRYWSSTARGCHAWYLNFNSGGVDVDSGDRCYGLSVRLVQD